jgi:hypothetical protein
MGHPVPGRYEYGDLAPPGWGSLEFETANMAMSPDGPGPQERPRWRGPVANINYRPGLSSERTPHIKKPATDSNKNAVMGT